MAGYEDRPSGQVEGEEAEDKPSEWHHRQSVYETELASMRAERESLAAEEVVAKKRKDETEKDAQKQEDEILAKAAAADNFRVAEFASLRERLAEVKDAADELLEDTDLKVEAIGEDSKAAREARYEAEREMREEAKKVAAILRRIEELEESERQQMLEKERLMAVHREESRKKVQKLRQVTEAKALEMEEQVLKDLQHMHQDLLQAKSEIYGGVKEEVLRRQEAMRAADDDIRSVDKAVNDGLEVAKSQAQDLRDTTHHKVLEVQARDTALEEIICQKVTASLATMEAAADAVYRADTAHRDATQRRQGAAEALGEVFPRSTNLHVHGIRVKQSPLAATARSVLGVAHE